MSQYHNPSNVGSFYLRHVQAMEPVRELPVGKSFGLELEGFSIDLLKDVLKDMKLEKKAIVIIPWYETNMVEIQRLPDGSNTKTFYKYLRADNQPKLEGGKSERVWECCQDYMTGNFDYSNYDANITAEMHASKMITYAILQRKLVPTALFRNAPEGATKALKVAVKELIDKGRLIEVPRTVGKERFKLGAKIFEIVVD